MHADARQVVLHLDTDAIAQEEFPAVNVPGSGGLNFAAVRGAMIEFVKNPNLLGLDVAQYNPDKDSDGAGAKKLVDLLVEALTARLEAIAPEEQGAAPLAAATTAVASSNEVASLSEATSSDVPSTLNETTANETSVNETISTEAPSSDETPGDEPPDEVSTKETSA
jgi:hypothetical protein